MDGCQWECPSSLNCLCFVGCVFISVKTQNSSFCVKHAQGMFRFSPTVWSWSASSFDYWGNCARRPVKCLSSTLSSRLLWSKQNQAGQSTLLICRYCSKNEVSLSIAGKATGSLNIFPLHCKYRNRWYPKEKRIYILYISRFFPKHHKGQITQEL